MARKRSQPYLSGFEKLNVREFGGALLKGNPREPRPISTKRPLHLVLKSSRAVGERSFLSPKRAKAIEAVIRRTGKTQGVRIYRFANSGNHLHLVVLPGSRKAFRSFVRAVSGLIARITLGAERGQPRGVQFWDMRPYTRIIEWGRDFRGTCGYLLQNTLEAIGFVPYKPRRDRHKTRQARAGPA